MKNLLFVVAVITVSLFSGCNKDDDEIKVYPLNGTTWKHVESGTENGGWTETTLIMFKETTFEANITLVEKNTSITDGGTGTYRYEPPYVYLEFGEDKITGTIDGSKLTIDGMILIKQ